jgi:hypothetical protein
MMMMMMVMMVMIPSMHAAESAAGHPSRTSCRCCCTLAAAATAATISAPVASAVYGDYQRMLLSAQQVMPTISNASSADSFAPLALCQVSGPAPMAAVHGMRCMMHWWE